MISKEQKKSYKLAFIYIFLTSFLAFFLFKFGLKGAVTISEFIQGSKPVYETDIYENILPAPQFYPILEATNSATLPLFGYSLPNNKVDIFLNDFNIKTLEVNSEGKFSGEIFLSLGTSNIYAVTKDNQNKQSSPSKTWTIFYGNSPPYLEIFEPINNSEVKGKNSQVNLKGKALNVSKVSVNDHSIILEKDGSFNYPVRLSNGENKFKIVCVDPAQNKTELEWILKYQP